MHGCCPKTGDAPGQENKPCSSATCSNCYQDPCGVYGCCGDDGTLPRIDFFGSNCPQKACYTGNEPCPICPNPSPAPPAPPAPVQCTICNKSNKNRPTSLTIEYSAGQGVNVNEQGTRSYGSGLYGNYGETSSVSSGGFSATVSDGQTFTVSGSFSAETTFNIGGTSKN